MKDERGLLTILVQECLKSPYVWLFAVSYFWVRIQPVPRLQADCVADG